MNYVDCLRQTNYRLSCANLVKKPLGIEDKVGEQMNHLSNKFACKSNRHSALDRLFRCLAVFVSAMLIANLVMPSLTVKAAPMPSIWGDIAGAVFARPAETIGDLLTKALGIERLIELSESAIDQAIDNAGEEARETVKVAGMEARSTLEKFRQDNESIILLLEKEYESALDVTIDSLDAISRRKLREVEDALMRVNKVLQEDIILLKESSVEVIQEAGQEISTVIESASFKIQDNIIQLEQTLENTVVIVTDSAAYLVDRLFNNIISAISLIFLGLGLLLFIYLFYARRLQKGLPATIATIFVGVFLAGFGTLLLFAPARAFVLISAQIGIEEKLEISKKKSVVYVMPSSLQPEQTKVLEIRGRHLTPGGAHPTVKFAGKSVPIIAAHETEITVDISNIALNKLDITKQTLVLQWENDPPPISVNLNITPTPLPAKSTPTPEPPAMDEIIAATQTAIAVENPAVHFSVDSELVDVDNCVKFTWRVEPVSSVTFNGNTVPNQGEQVECPLLTGPFILRFVKLNGDADSRTIAITVRPTPIPTTPTPLPRPTPKPTLDISNGPCGLPNPPPRCNGTGTGGIGNTHPK